MGKKAINKAPKKIFARPPIDGTDEELEAWCEAFIAAMRGKSVEITDQGEKPEEPKK